MEISSLIIGVVAGVVPAILYGRLQLAKAKVDRDQLIEESRRQGELEKDRLLDEAHEKIQIQRDELIREWGERREKLEEIINSIDSKHEILEKRYDKFDAVQQRVDESFTALDEKRRELMSREELIEKAEKSNEDRFHALANMNEEQAQEEMLTLMRQGMEEEEKNQLHQVLERVEASANKRSRELILETMQRYAAECAYDRTSVAVPLPSDEIKGRIIGRDGRNIRTIEALTGANIIIDDTPETVVVSCFEPYRREVAKNSLEKLVEDGRIHPNRIHEVVTEMRENLERDMLEAASFVCNDLNISEFNQEIMAKLGRLKFRFNSSQNLLQHSKEVAFFMGLLAAELGLNTETAKRLGVLHCIGLAFDEHVDEDYLTVGASFLKRHGEEDELTQAILDIRNNIVINNSWGQLLKTCVTLSESRPGARHESMEQCINRLHKMEHIATSFDGVEEARVVQAGRELIATVCAEKVSENHIDALAAEIGRRLSREISFPGPVQVSIIREKHATVEI